MRPTTVIHLTAGLVLGTAFAVSLVLPGKVVLPDKAPIVRLVPPRPPAQIVVRAAPIQRAHPRLVVQPVVHQYEPAPEVRTVPISHVMHVTRTRSHRPRPARPKPAPAPAAAPPAQTLQPLAAPDGRVTKSQKQDKTKKREGGDHGDKHGHDSGGHDHGHKHDQGGDHGHGHDHGDEHGHGNDGNGGNGNGNGEGNGNGNGNGGEHGHGGGGGD